jgi:hypothetical protein
MTPALKEHATRLERGGVVFFERDAESSDEPIFDACSGMKRRLGGMG